MPDVPQYNLPKFGHYTPSKQEANHERTEKRYWRYKKNVIIKGKKTKLVDKHLIAEDIERMNHIRSISREL